VISQVSRSELEVGRVNGALVHATQQYRAAGGTPAEDGEQRVASTAEGDRRGERRRRDAETADIDQVLAGARPAWAVKSVTDRHRSLRRTEYVVTCHRSSCQRRHHSIMVSLPAPALMVSAR
jgi:hypothetical protein